MLGRTEVFRHLGLELGTKGGMDGEIQNRVREGKRVLGGLREVWKKGNLPKKIKVRMFESMAVPTVLYGCGAWTVNNEVRKKLEVLEIYGLRMICGVSRRQKVRNVTIRQRCGWNRGLVERCEQGILRWFGHLVRMDNERLVRRVYDSNVAGTRGRGKPKGKWLDGVKGVLWNRGLDVEQGMIKARDRDAWRGFVRGARLGDVN